jgi:hypothetical protein
MKKTFKYGAIFVMSILSATILAQTTNDSKTVVNTNGVSMPACKRWTWSGDVYNRKVICLEWREENKNKEGKNK